MVIFSMVTVILLSVNMLNVVVLSLIMLNVAAPHLDRLYFFDSGDIIIWKWKLIKETLPFGGQLIHVGSNGKGEKILP
jgi:hypothetical protein